MFFVVVAYAGVRYNLGFGRYTIVWLSGCLAYYDWNVRQNMAWRYSRLWFCLCVIGIIALTEMGRAWFSYVSDLTNILYDMLVLPVIAWLLFRFRIPVSKRLADCSYSLYVIHFPLILMVQSFLVASWHRSFVAAFCATLASLIVSSILVATSGIIELQKTTIQNWALILGGRVRQVFVRTIKKG